MKPKPWFGSFHQHHQNLHPYQPMHQRFPANIQHQFVQPPPFFQQFMKPKSGPAMLFLNLEPPKSVETLQLPIMSVASSQDTTKLKRHSSSIGNINTDKNSLEYSAPNKEIIPINQQKSYTESNSKNTFTSSLEYDILARKRLPKEEGTPIETTTGIKEGKNEPKVEESPPEVDTATLNQVKFYKSFLISFHKFANLCSGWGLLQSSRSIWIQRGI